MIELYGAPRTSAGRCYLVLEEIGVAYKPIPIDMLEKREHKSEAYLKLNPNGKVPCLVDGNLVLWESIAINHYLAEKYKPELLGKTVEDRAHVAQWSAWSQLELQPPMIDIFIQMVFTPEEKRDANLIARAQAAIPTKLEILDKHLKNRTYLVGEAPTVADFNVASVVNITIPLKIDRSPYPILESWFTRLKSRPSFKKWSSLRN